MPSPAPSRDEPPFWLSPHPFREPPPLPPPKPPPDDDE